MNNDSVKRTVFSALRNSAWLCVLLVIAVAGAVCVSIIPPQLLKIIIDNNIIPGVSEGLLTLAFAYFGAVFFIGAFDMLKEGVLTVLGQRIVKEIRARMIKKLHKINAAYFSANSSGETASRFLSDVEAINTLFTAGIVGMAADLFKIIGIIISIFFFGWKLGLFVLAALPLVYFITRAFQKRMLKAQLRNRVITAKMNSHISESLKNAEILKAYSKEGYMERNYTVKLLETYKTSDKVNFYDSFFSPVIMVIRTVVIAAVAVLSASSVGFLGITAGALAASIELIINLFAPVESLGMELQAIQQAISGIKRTDEFFSLAEDESKKELTYDDIFPSGKKTEIRFDGVTFAYQEGIDVLKNINLVCCGGSTAFAGRTGVGKTTLFKLITGLIKPTAGSVTINGIDVCYVPNPLKRRIFGYVGQDAPLLKGTVAEQISLRDESVTRGQIESVLDFVGLSEYVNSLENGIDTVIKNVALFSQGQKQLLALARALVSEPPVLLLDEVTANLDSLTEEKVIKVLLKAGGGRTVLSVSHRLSAIASADAVVILENGMVRNSGSPNYLSENDEWYRSRIGLEKLTWD